ncbi:replicative DNA helicase [Hydrogenispora ethanolica]|uniref:Replicative DNA helicase n=1 Tax=Hydrogenispora ethanolica TaxID=1082276 RepID=A0A4R1S510_HYDET|nr:replicative DNA helicase [Hydrogenispora ethanolica]TCL74209.1 replicative DNA helicase [Hydrogenispora ethanolica]
MSYIPPQNIEAEQSLLGSCLLLGQKAVDEASLIITEADFYRETHRMIWEVIQRLSTQNIPIDIISVSEAFGNRLGKIGGRQYLLQLANATPTLSNIPIYAGIIKSKSLARLKIAECQETIKQLVNEEDPTEIISKSMLSDMRILNQGKKDSIERVSDRLFEVYDKIGESKGKNGITGVPTGYPDLDRIGGGLQVGMIVLAARPSMGKTTFAMNIARNVALAGNKALIFSLEMTKEQLIRKFLAMESGLNSKLFNNAGEIQEEQWKQLARGLNSLQEAGIFIDDTSGVKASQILIKARRFKSLNPDLGLIVIDYMGLIAPESNKGNTNEKIGEISKIIKTMSKELNLPVLILAQLNRGVETRDDKIPTLADLRDSGNIEQDADAVMFLYREDYYNNPEEGAPDPSETFVIMRKNRLDGGIGAAKLIYFKAVQRFTSIARPDLKEAC